ncbi:MAG: hypothetical protein AAGJ82_00460 [Bacteroidota bacterium]
MFDHWLTPYSTDTTFEPTTLGHYLTQGRKKGTALAEGQCVLIGLDKTAAKAVREQLYPLIWSFGEQPFADLGNLRKTSTNFVLPLLRELHDSRLFPIFLGSKPALVRTQYQAFLQIRSQVNLAIIDERAPFHLTNKRAADGYLNAIVHERLESLFQLSLIGAQAHFTPTDYFDWLASNNFTSLRLGAAREQLAQVEPILRDADVLVMHLAALKRAEAPAQLHASPSGFLLEEACQLCRYAGMSDKLRSFGLYGLDTSNKRELRHTAQSVAQLVWYFLDGYFQRVGDYPVTNKGLTEYIVDGKGKGEKLTFWKSPRSGRWWLQVPVDTPHQYQRHRLIPCSYEDYLQTTQEELPDRLWAAFRRF